MSGKNVTIMDRRQRPLVVFRPNGQVMYYRYVDMDPSEREIILKFYRYLRESEQLGPDNEHEDETGLEAFLDFKNDYKICG